MPENKNMTTLNDLPMLQVVEVDEFCRFRRVPDGFVMYDNRGDSISSIFIPYANSDMTLKFEIVTMEGW